MSTIGLFDDDIYRYIHVPFNLELMKLATYYKSKRDIVNMSLEYDPTKYTTYFFYKDYEDGIYPDDLLKIKNLKYGGLAFSKTYYPLDESIEKCRPDVSIYLPYKKSFITNKSYECAYNVMNNGMHMRYSLDEKTIWENYTSQIRDLPNQTILFLHDRDIANIDGAYELTKDLLDKMRHSLTSPILGLKFPIRTDNIEVALKWLSFKPTEQYSTIYYEGILEDEECVALSNAPSFKKMEYNLTPPSFDEEKFLNTILPRLYKQVIFFRRNRQRILLKYDANFFSDPRCADTLRLFNSFSKSLLHLSDEWFERYIKEDSLYSFATTLRDDKKFQLITKEDARIVFNFIREKNYPLFRDFYECHNVELKGGKFENV